MTVGQFPGETAREYIERRLEEREWEELWRRPDLWADDDDDPQDIAW